VKRGADPKTDPSFLWKEVSMSVTAVDCRNKKTIHTGGCNVKNW